MKKYVNKITEQWENEDFSLSYIIGWGFFVPVRRKQQIANLYKSRKRESRHYMNRLQANGTFDLETYGKELLKYLEIK